MGKGSSAELVQDARRAPCSPLAGQAVLQPRRALRWPSDAIWLRLPQWEQRDRALGLLIKLCSTQDADEPL